MREESEGGGGTTIYYPPGLRELWLLPYPGEPTALAKRWHQEYPGLFDEDDLRLTVCQPELHFHEWYAAIHLLQRDGVFSMGEKYDSSKYHPLKFARYTEILNAEQRAIAARIQRECNAQLPDLLVPARDRTSFSFAEVKGPRDKLWDEQIASHKRIRNELKVPVEVIWVKLTDAMPTGSG